MLVHEIIDKNIAPLKVNDSVALALTKLDLLYVTRFPVVDEGQLIGMVSLDTLIGADNEELEISALTLQDSISIPESQHLFEAARTMLVHEQFILPVVDQGQHFVGVIKKRDVLQALGDIFNLESFGSVITIEMIPYDFTLTEVIRLIETEQAKILGVAVEQPNEDNGFYRVSIKLNMEDSSNVCSTLQRYGYVVTSQVSSAVMERDLSERADELIRYLDI
ncbi:MAG: CBS domain-containing protein [Balneolaceae bacterium]|nr:CBS domain-containing protein [Balneolaceae bacterium]